MPEKHILAFLKYGPKTIIQLFPNKINLNETCIATEYAALFFKQKELFIQITCSMDAYLNAHFIGDSLCLYVSATQTNVFWGHHCLPVGWCFSGLAL